MVGQVRPLSATSPSSPRSPFQRSPVSHLWERLRTCITGISNYVNARLISNESELTVPCPVATVVFVKIRGASVPMHANTITFDSVRVGSAAPANAPANVRQAIAGRSPRMHAEYEKFLVQGLESGRGLFQFISPRALRFSNDPSDNKPSKVTPIIDQLITAMAESMPKNVSLAGRYEVTALKKEVTDGVADHCCYQLTVFDTVDNKHITVPLTQAGLKFDQRVLQHKDIERANVLLDQHRTQSGQSGTAPDPMIVSTGGIGRNATLITYRQVLARMGSGSNPADLMAEIEAAVQDGRRDRGRGFIHSEEQMKELHTALELKMRQPANAVTTGSVSSPRPAGPPSSRQRRLSLPTTASKVILPHGQSKVQSENKADEDRLISGDVSTIEQLEFCGHYNRDLHQQMEDKNIGLGNTGNQTSLVSEVVDHLRKTRGHQSISGVKNYCWLRSSWLPLFAALRPDQLDKRLLEITPPAFRDHSKKQIIPVLRAIASLYRRDPAAFMEGKPKSKDGAVLGPSSKLTDALPHLPTGFIPSNPDQTIEAFLRQLQLNIAAAFRPEITDAARRENPARVQERENKLQDPKTKEEDRKRLNDEINNLLHSHSTAESLIAEIEKLSKNFDPATSDLPVTLHRAFNVPVIVVESKWDEDTQLDIGYLRVANNDPACMERAGALALSDGLTKEHITEFMSAFKHEFIIKLTGGHYELFLPEK